MNLFSTLSMSASALGVNQSAISVLSNNIANMNTDGYSKQKVNLAAVTIGASIGNSTDAQASSNAGVEIESITRYNDQFLGNYYRSQLTSESYLDKSSTQSTNIANLFDELGGQGLDTSIENFYTSLNNLNQYPTDYSARSNFITNATALTTSMNTISQNLTKLKTDSVGDGTSQESLKNSEIYSTVNDVNTCLSNIANINKQLATSTTGTLDNNNLLDARDSELNTLAGYGNFTVDLSSDGIAEVSIGNTSLVKGAQVTGTIGVQTAADYSDYCTKNGITDEDTSNAILTITTSDDKVIQDANSKFTSGKVAGILDSNNGTSSLSVDSILSKLNTLASTVSSVFNNLQTRDGAYYYDNTTGKLSNDGLKNYKLFVSNDNTSTYSYDSDGTGTQNITYKLDSTPDATEQANIATATGSPYDSSSVYYKGTDGTYIKGAPDSGTISIYKGGSLYASSASSRFTDTSITAANISVNNIFSETNGVYKIATAYFDNPSDVNLNSTGNANNIIGMINTKTDTTNSSYSSINNESFEDYYKGIVNDISDKATQASNDSTTQSNLVSSIKSKLDNETKVDLNEELTDLIKFQTAYSASARVFSTCNDILSTLVSMGQ